MTTGAVPASPPDGVSPPPDGASPPIEQERLGGAALRGGIAVGLAQAVRVGTQLLSVLLLARLLSPRDFGMVASVAPVTAFVATFQDAGLQQAIVQRRDMDAEQLTRIFWVTVALGTVCAAVVAALGPAVATFFRDDRLGPLTVAAAAPLLIASLASVPMALLNRALRFRALALIDIASVTAGLASAVASALLGANYWSLVIAPAVTNAVNLGGAWRAARWTPGPPAWRLPERAMLGFGMNLTGFGILNFFARNLDNVLIGRVAGAVALGFYDRAYKLLLFPLQNINAPIARVMIPLLSRIEADKPRFRAAYLRAATQVALVTVPGMAAAIAVSHDVVQVLFGERWMAVAPIFAWLGIAGLLQPINNSTGWIFIAQARTGTMFRWSIYAAATTIASFVAGLHWGALGVAAAYAISDYVVRAPVLYWVIGRVGPVSAWDLLQVQGPLLAAAGATWVVAAGLLQPAFGLAGVPLVALTLVVSYALAAVALCTFPGGRAAVRELRHLAGRLAGRILGRG